MSRQSTRAKHAAAWEGRDGPRQRAGTFSDEKPHPCERLAHVTGQTTYWLVVDGDERARDMSMDMAALAIAQRHSDIPAPVLEAYWGGSALHRYALGSLILRSMERMRFRLKQRERIAVKGAILDAVDRFRGASIPAAGARARQLRIDKGTYLAVLKTAGGLLDAWRGYLQPEWIDARFKTANTTRFL